MKQEFTYVDPAIYFATTLQRRFKLNGKQLTIR